MRLSIKKIETREVTLRNGKKRKKIKKCKEKEMKNVFMFENMWMGRSGLCQAINIRTQNHLVYLQKNLSCVCLF